MLAQESAQDVRQLYHQFSGLIRLKAHQRRNGVQGVKEKMRIDLALQGIETGLQQQPLLLLQLDFDAGGIPDLDRDRYRGNRSGKDRDLNPKIRAVQIEDVTRKCAAHNLSYKLQHQDADEESHLPVVTRNREVAADPAIEAQVHHRREGPYIFAVWRQLTEGPGHVSGSDIHGKSEPFMAKKRGKRTHHRA